MTEIEQVKSPIETALPTQSNEEELMEEELQAYIDEGENDGGEFAINKDVTLRQDMLSKHLANLLDERDAPLPWIPLC